jgi:hypothetical protein
MVWITEAINKRLVKDINGIMDETYAQISKHAKDIIQKYTSGLFRNATLEFYGVKTAKIKELINVELPVVRLRKNHIKIRLHQKSKPLFYKKYRKTCVLRI